MTDNGLKCRDRRINLGLLVGRYACGCFATGINRNPAQLVQDVEEYAGREVAIDWTA